MEYLISLGLIALVVAFALSRCKKHSGPSQKSDLPSEYDGIDQ